MHVNPHHPAAQSSLSSLFSELDTKLDQALTCASSLSPNQWRDVDQRLQGLHSVLAITPGQFRSNLPHTAPADLLVEVAP